MLVGLGQRTDKSDEDRASGGRRARMTFDHLPRLLASTPSPARLRAASPGHVRQRRADAAPRRVSSSRELVAARKDQLCP